MGLPHALEILHALALVAQGPGAGGRLHTTLSLPYPHLQQRLQQSLRGVALTVAAATIGAWAFVLLTPGPAFGAPGWLSLAAALASLSLLGLLHVLIRAVLLPQPHAASAATEDRASAGATAHGWTQTLLCGLVEVLARIYQQPQLLVLATLSMTHVWLTRTIAVMAFATSADVTASSGQFGAFVLASGVVTFFSLVALEPRLAEDPFVLDATATLRTAVLRDGVRAVRRGVGAWLVARVGLFVLRADAVSIFAFRFHRAAFHITSATIESFVLLVAMSVFRTLLFRPNHHAISDATESGELWDSLDKRRSQDPATATITRGLFSGKLAVSYQNATPLAEQYVVAMKKRMDNAVKQVTERKISGASSTQEHVECLEDFFLFANMSTVTKFNASCRRKLYESPERWRAVIQTATATIDSFTMALQLFNSIPDRKHVGHDDEVVYLEKSVSNLLRFLLSKGNMHPLLVIDTHPHLSNLRISSKAIKSKIRYYFESRLQFAIRRFLLEEARRRVFVQLEVVHACVNVMSHLISKSRDEDANGIVQHTVPATLSSLVECNTAIESYIDVTTKVGANCDTFVSDATALARGIDKAIYRITDAFYKELSSFTFSSSVTKALDSYTNFRK